MKLCECEPAGSEIVAEKGLRWGLPGGGYWAGSWQTDRRSLAVTDPTDGSLILYVTDATDDDVREAITGVKDALSIPWELWKRREALQRASELVREESGKLAQIIASEGSKTLTEASGEVARCAETLRLSSVASGNLEGQTLPFEDSTRGSGRIGWNRREPVGVIAAITPFNDPLNLVAHKVGPALIGGNGVVLKPAQVTPLSALALTDILVRSGVPAGRIATIIGSGSIGSALVSDPRVDLISFTGGPATADKIARSAGARKMLMELGGNNATIVCEDADVIRAAAEIVAGAFGVAGQNCLSVQRVFVHRSVYEELRELVVSGTKQLKIGCKMEPSTNIGPMITETEAKRVEAWIEEARQRGATIECGGMRHGNFYEPTVVTGAQQDDRIVADEIFGPVVSLFPFDDISDAIAQTESTDFALQAGVFTKSIAAGFEIASQLHVGSVLINETSDFRIDAMPFGGFKRSGIGREGIASAVEAMTEPKNFIVNTG